MTTCELAYEEVGSGPPLLLLHGLFGSSSNWRTIAKSLGDVRRVLSVDLRNHGASPWAATVSYDEMAADVAALIDRLGLARDGAPDVLGHSMGGKVAMTLALAEPERVGRLIVVDVAPVTYADRFSSYIAAMAAIDTRRAKSREEIKRALLATIPDERVVGFLLTNLVRRDDGYAWRVNLDGLASSMPVISAFPASLEGRRFDGPVTVIDGEQSSYISAADRPRFLAFFPRARFETVRDAGHWLHADQPAAFLEKVRGALSA